MDGSNLGSSRGQSSLQIDRERETEILMHSFIVEHRITPVNKMLCDVSFAIWT